MAKEAENSGGRKGIPWRMLGWGTAALLLLLPLVAMRFTNEVNWTASDFVFAGVLILSVGIPFELAVRKSASIAYRAGVGFALAAAFLTVWANGAVGMIGSEDNPYNLLFGGVIAIALIGAVVARLKAAGMAGAMAVSAVAQVAIGAGGLSTDVRGAILSMGFAVLWLLAAALFRNAALEQTPASATPRT